MFHCLSLKVVVAMDSIKSSPTSGSTSEPFAATAWAGIVASELLL